MQYLVAWFPDWPLQAGYMTGQITPDPAVLTTSSQVMHSNAAARALGVRRGMRPAQARALYPELQVVAVDEERDATAFRTILESFGEAVSAAEILRPGMLALNYAAASNFHGKDVMETLANAAALPNLDYSFGIAPDITTAIIAARLGKVTTQPAEFLASVPTRILRDEPTLGCDIQVVHTFEDLGLGTLGDIAALPARSVHTRFGYEGYRCYLIAQGQLRQFLQPTDEDVDLQVRMSFEEPLARLDQVIFAAKRLAVELHNLLVERNLVCTRLHIQALSGEHTYARTWSTQKPLTEDEIAQRIRWQFAGWNNAPLDALVLFPECSLAQPQLWAGSHHKAAESIARVQHKLGLDAVQQPIHAGGRGVAERVALVPYGQTQQPEPLWRGALPEPLPARVFHPAALVQLTDGRDVTVELEGDHLSAEPAVLAWGRKRYEVQAWAGPWLVDDAWWKGGQPCARIQVQCETSAFLLAWVGNWRMEASYE
ncbi:MAG: DNA polymerase Y family protein [Corynebacterium sp.]|nr:DNA polymerase Y family protein [Corynebacterium sp.]